MKVFYLLKRLLPLTGFLHLFNSKLLFELTNKHDLMLTETHFFSQVFEIYESLPDPTLGHMNEVVKGAVNICSGVYIAVGLFGNIACSGLDLGGEFKY